jgi:hypothetical protein
VRDSYPLPRMDQCIDCLGDATIISTLDCNSGYWKIPVNPADRQKRLLPPMRVFTGSSEYRLGCGTLPQSFNDSWTLGLRESSGRCVLLIWTILSCSRSRPRSTSNTWKRFFTVYVATRKLRSVYERRQELRDCMTVSGRINHGGVPVPFTQGNPRAVKWVRDRTDYRLNKTLNERKVVLSQNRVTICSFPSVTTLARGLK